MASNVAEVPICFTDVISKILQPCRVVFIQLKPCSCILDSYDMEIFAFSVGGAPLANKDSFKYLGMVSIGPITFPNLLSILSWLVVTELGDLRKSTI